MVDMFWKIYCINISNIRVYKCLCNGVASSDKNYRDVQ